MLTLVEMLRAAGAKAEPLPPQSAVPRVCKANGAQPGAGISCTKICLHTCWLAAEELPGAPGTERNVSPIMKMPFPSQSLFFQALKMYVWGRAGRVCTLPQSFQIPNLLSLHLQGSEPGRKACLLPGDDLLHNE